MNMRKYRGEDLGSVMDIADSAWRPIWQMRRETLGEAIADILNAEGNTRSKGLQVKQQIESGRYGIAGDTGYRSWWASFLLGLLYTQKGAVYTCGIVTLRSRSFSV